MGVKSQLKKAKKELIKRGWAQTDLENGKGCVCILGAVGFAVLGDQFDRQDYAPFRLDNEAGPVVEALINQLPSYKGETLLNYDYDRLYDFNDTVAEDVEDVIALIDKAIEAA